MNKVHNKSIVIHKKAVYSMQLTNERVTLTRITVGMLKALCYILLHFL